MTTELALYDTPPEDPYGAAPHVHAERQVLGSMLLNALAVDDASRVITGADYESPRHEVIHAATVALATSGRPHDVTAVADALSASGDLVRVGGVAYLYGLALGVATHANAGYYAAIVLEASVRRAVRLAGMRLQQISDADGSAVEVVNAARDEFDRTVDRDGSDAMSNSDAVDEAIAALDADPGMPTPWHSLTQTISGWSPSELYVCAARPGIGKSIVAVASAIDCARRGKTAVLFSLEMSRVELYHRMLSAVGDVDGTRIRHRTLRREDRDALARAAEHIRRLPLVVHARTGVTVADVRMLTRREQLRSDVGLVAVDYLAKLKPADGRSRHDRRVEVDSLIWGLKETAIDLHVPVLALAQLNRAIETRTDKRPQLSDLRESGGIEADADVIIMLHRARDLDEGDPSDLQMIIRKNRHGPSDVDLSLIFRGHKSRIDEYQDYEAAVGA